MIRRTKLTFDAQRWKAEEALAREGVSIMVCAGTGCIAGGAMKIAEFVRFEKGEGMQKREDNFADEVASMMK